MFIVKTKKNQVIRIDTPRPGDRVLAGTYLDNQRRIQMAEGEDVRIHGSNGGYLFSVRLYNNTPTMFFETAFSEQRNEHETPIELYPWLKKGVK